MERMQLAIGRLLFIGVLISAFIVLVGGSLYLLQNSHNTVHYQVFQSEPLAFRSLKDILYNLLNFSPLEIIQFGLFFLVFVQILRVALTMLMFIKVKDKWFILISFFILVILIYSLFWRGF